MGGDDWVSRFAAVHGMGTLRRRVGTGGASLERMKQSCESTRRASGAAAHGGVGSDTGGRRASWALFEDRPVDLSLIHPKTGGRARLKVSPFVRIAAAKAEAASALAVEASSLLLLCEGHIVDDDALLMVDMVDGGDEGAWITLATPPVPDWAFSPILCSPGVVADAPGRNRLVWASCAGDDRRQRPWGCVRCTCALPARGRLSWATRIDVRGQLMVGIARSDAAFGAEAAPLHNQRGKALLLNLTGGTLYPGGASLPARHGAPSRLPRARAGSVLLLSFDCERRTVSLRIDGVPCGAVFGGVPSAGDGLRWHPAWEAQEGTAISVGLVEC